MSISFLQGLFSVLTATSAPALYRYPYRNGAEGMRADWMRVGEDMRRNMRQLGMTDDEETHA